MVSEFRDRIDAVADRVARTSEAFDPPADPPDEARALEYLREGFGPLVAVYVDARTGGEFAVLSPGDIDRLESGMNASLELYAACYGVDLDAEFAVRPAADLLVETRDVRDTAQVLTRVPSRHSGIDRHNHHNY